MSLSLEYQGTLLYEIAVEPAEQYTDDFETQEEFIEGVLLAFITVTSGTTN